MVCCFLCIWMVQHLPQAWLSWIMNWRAPFLPAWMEFLPQSTILLECISWSSFMLSGIFILRLGPSEGRIRLRTLAAIAFMISLGPTAAFTLPNIRMTAAMNGVSLPSVFPNSGALLGYLFFIPVVAWNLTWSLDAVRRRRRALDAAKKT